MCKAVWIGVDLGKSAFVVALCPEGTRSDAWASLETKEFPNRAEGLDAFAAWVAEHAPAGIRGMCVESTGRLSWTFIEALDGRLGGVSMLNPARSHDFAKSLGLRSKTDRIDACVLALYGQAMTPRPTEIPSSFQRQLRELSRHYDITLSEKNACENRLREPIASPFVLASLNERVQCAKDTLAAIEKEIDGLIATDEQLGKDYVRMQTIPGVGPKTARALIAQFGNLRAYKRNELVALVGVYPRSHQSGTSVYKKGKLARGGGARQRAVLYMAALCAMRRCPHMNRYAQRLRERGFTAMVILGAIMRKLLLLIRTLIVSGNDYDPNYAHAV